jgi:hypothetical protein
LPERRENEIMANLSKTTQDHEEIRRWAEERRAQPACVKGTGDEGDTGLLRLDFPGYSGEQSLQHISWEEWFQKFDERNLALLYQEETAGGDKSNFNKIVSAGTAQEVQSGSQRKRGSTRSSGRSRAAKKAGGKQTATKVTASRSVQKKSGTAAKATARKSSGTTPSSRKGPSKKSAAKKTAAKKSSAKRPPARTSASKSGPAKSMKRRSKTSR